MRSAVLFIYLLLLSSSLLGQKTQNDELEIPESVKNLIEDYLANNEETNFDFNTLLEILDDYLYTPLDINKSTADEWREIGLLSEIQIQNIIKHKEINGDFISLYELQSVEGLDIDDIKRLLPFIDVKGDTDDYNLPITTMLLDGRNELYVRWGRTLEDQLGYISEDPDIAPKYEGSPDQLYLRYKHAYGNRLSYGFTAEKDKGEAFFNGSNKNGFDFYSFHFYLRDYTSKIKALALGDYGISMGQGLILYSGFSSGKSSMVTNIRRGGRVVRPYTSVNEYLYMRGAALTYGINPNLTATVFASYRKRDANTSVIDSVDVENSLFTSLQSTGLHRTTSEIEDEKTIGHYSAGGVLKYKTPGKHIALNALYHNFEGNLERSIRPYNRFYFQGGSLLNVSLDYSFFIRNISIFGETAMSDNGAVATLNGILIGLDPKVDFAFFYRNFPRDYQTLDASPFAETNGARNEEGVYTGVELRPFKKWKLTAYYDLWSHPWLRSLTNAPSRAHEYRVRLTYWKKRKYEAYMEIRNESKALNVPNEETQVKDSPIAQNFQTRLHLNYKVNKSLELRSRMDFGYYELGGEPKQKGVVMYQDVIFKPRSSPLSFTFRYVLMDTDGFNARYYSYENNLLNQFSIPAYYNRGSRSYINLRYKGIKDMTIEARIAQLHWNNVTTIGSSGEEINGTKKTEVSAQIKYKF